MANNNIAPEPFDFPVVILGLPFHIVDANEVLTWCVARAKIAPPSMVATANLDFLLQAKRDPEFYSILANTDLVVADGMPIVWLSGWLGPALPSRIAGSDLVLSLAQAAARQGLSIFNLGGARDVPEKAGAALTERITGLKIAGAYSPPKASLEEMDHEEILLRLEAAKPDILYVAFGAPKQEKFINMHRQRWYIPLALGIGGSLDFLAGEQKRSPVFLQKIGLEWFWRLSTNPKRLWRRYGSNFVFLGSAIIKILILKLYPHKPGFVSLPPDEHAQAFHVVTWPSNADKKLAQKWLDDILAAQAAPRALVVNLINSRWLNSCELGLLFTLAVQARKNNKRVLLTGVGEPLAKWLDMNLIFRQMPLLKKNESWEQWCTPKQV